MPTRFGLLPSITKILYEIIAFLIQIRYTESLFSIHEIYMFRKLQNLIAIPLFVKRADSENQSDKGEKMEKVQIKTMYNVNSVITQGGKR